jgi:hypothetical protein
MIDAAMNTLQNAEVFSKDRELCITEFVSKQVPIGGGGQNP